jgi:hypothetical protein
MTSRRRGVFVIACVALLAGLTSAPASAFHIPGASYGGNVSGGGTISFTVSSDGTSVMNLTLTGPIGRPACSVSSKQYSQAIPITNNTFDNGEVSGGFPNVQGAYGRLNIVVPGVLSSCRIAETWSATTGASPTGSAECQAALVQVKRAKKALTKAKRIGKLSKIKKRRAQWGAAKSARDQFCG